MANEQDRNATPGTESDMSKAQSQQQPPQQAKQPPETGEQRGELESGQPDAGLPDEGLQGETATQQRTDVEGASLQSETKGEAESGFVGAEGQKDSSSELIKEKDEDLAKGGQGAPEGK